VGDRPARYVALGDSFTAGAAGSGEPSFADHLAELLRDARPELEYTNLAVPGARTVAVRPDVRGHMTAFEHALETLRVCLPSALVATATTPDPGRFLPLRPRSAQRVTHAIELINDATRAAAARRGVPCLDLARHPEARNPRNYAHDGYHPSAEASRRAAGAFASVIGIRLGIHLDTQEVM
jgi:lysophospholipase L1-like esterase